MEMFTKTGLQEVENIKKKLFSQEKYKEGKSI